MPNRIIKESINESMGLSECSVFAEDLYKRLITYADDYGRFNADTMIMRARLYPREYETVTEEDIVEGLVELSGVGKIEFYEPQIFNHFGKRGIYGAFPNWSEHQRVRDSKKKCPEPSDTSINDWYLRRFVPIDMKAQILERDNFKCQLCGKFVTTCKDGKRFVKLGSGLYHIDHIVPVLQGGRATLENLRLTCPHCNQSRKKRFTFAEILAETLAEKNGELPQAAESCGEPPRVAAIIQSNPNTNPNPNTNKGSRFAPPTLDEVRAYCEERHNGIDAQHFVDYYSRQGWMLSNGRKMKDWKATVRTWEQREKKPPAVTKKSGTAYGGNTDPSGVRAAYLQLCEELGEDPEETA
jgi:5-methylcytosine-specific restriction endonuclease McrA